jgi:hypothetical protein
MVPASEYPKLSAEILDVTVDREATAIRIRVRNAGPAVVDRVRLKVQYFETARGEVKGGEAGPRPIPVAEWILDMPRREWDPYDLPDSPEAACDPADPLPPGQTYEFTLRHCGGVPYDWAYRGRGRDQVLNKLILASHKSRQPHFRGRATIFVLPFPYKIGDGLKEDTG